MLRALLLFVLCCLSPAAFAGYAQLAPPPGFQSVGGVSTMPVGVAANGARYAGGHVMANASLNLGARTVTVPVGMRVAANAAAFAVTRLNPWVAGLSLAAAAVPYVVDWFRGTDLEVTSESLIRVRASGGTKVPAGNGDYWVVSGGQVVRISTVAMPSSCNGVAGYPACTTGQSTGVQIACWNQVRSGCYSSAPDPIEGGNPARPATEADLAPLVSKPINPSVFPSLGIPLPVDPVPVINPATEPAGDVLVGPQGNPAPQLQPHPNPLRFPDGDPVPIPGTDPPLYNQPWLEVHPSPTPESPWRVDIRPIVTQTTNPNPQPDPTPSKPNPPFDFYTDCEKFPGSLGCTPVGEAPSPEAIPTETRTLELQNGPSFNGGGCPANLTFTLKGQTFTGIDMAQPCAWISGLVKPVILLLAFISAVGIVRSALKG